MIYRYSDRVVGLLTALCLPTKVAGKSKWSNLAHCYIIPTLVLAPVCGYSAQAKMSVPHQQIQYAPYVERCVNVLMKHGTDTYGEVHTPLLVSILDVQTRACPEIPEKLDESFRVSRRGRRNPVRPQVAAPTVVSAMTKPKSGPTNLWMGSRNTPTKVQPIAQPRAVATNQESHTSHFLILVREASAGGRTSRLESSRGAATLKPAASRGKGA